VRTAIVSDLHLGNGYGEDLLRDPAIRRTLIEEIAGADRLVLLGDVIELRELPLPAVLDIAGPFFEELGEAMDGRTVILVPGNHDHRLAEPLLERRALAAEPLGLEQRAAPAGEAATRIGPLLGGAELELAYPGLWLRDDVYATHGHYMDCHMSLPRTECIAAAAALRASGRLPERPSPVDYERVLRPLYGFAYALAQVRRPGGRGARPSERAWRTFSRLRNGRGRASRVARRAAFGLAVPAAVWSLNRLLRSEFDADLGAGAISRSGIAAAIELAERLGVDRGHAITGHTHRAGPNEGEAEWPLPGGGRLHNTGNWIFADAFHHPGTPPGPYWPGTVTWLDETGPPRRVQLLVDRPHDELAAAVDGVAAGVRDELRATRR
jgi:Calcineurin-like phosphoesterase